MQKLCAHFWQDGSGATAIEYALIAGGLSIVIILAVQGIGTTLTNVFTNVNTQLR